MDSEKLNQIKSAVNLLATLLAEVPAEETTQSGEAPQKHATFPGSKRKGQ